MATPKVILVTGASTGFGALTARLCAQAGHVVWASHYSDLSPSIKETEDFARENKCDIRNVQLDVTSESYCENVVSKIMQAPEGRLDVMVHNAGHMGFGPLEAFSPEQLMRLYDINCVGCHRLNRHALPYMREAGKGLLVWVSSSSTRGPCSPFLGPYFAAKAGQDSLAQTYSVELSKWGIETTIVTPGIFTKGTNHFASAGKPEDQGLTSEYMDGPYKGWDDQCMTGNEAMCPPDADPADVARAVLKAVDTTHGKRPFRLHAEPAEDGAEVVNTVADRIRKGFLEKMGCGDLMRVTVN